MTSQWRSISLIVVLIAGATTALAQNEGNAPAIITGFAFEIERYTLAGYQDPVVFDPSDLSDPENVAREMDIVIVYVFFEDQDIVTETIEEDDQGNQTVTYEPGDEEFFAQKNSEWLYDFPNPPEPPPLGGDTWYFRSPPGLRLDPFPAETGTFAYSFIIPEWTGPSQARLRDPTGHPYDVGWVVTVQLANVEEPGEEDYVDRASFDLYAVENTALRPPNPPPFADAGPDQVVAQDSVVTLDGSRTFDAFNVGFDPSDPNVFEKDTIDYVWEWVSGPERVDPVPNDDGNPATAQVTLEVVGDYVYRLVVEDGVNPLPSTDEVQITVLSSIPVNQPPHAVISGPTGSVAVGATVELSAADSYDPDGDQLHYRWRQTNEVGGTLDPDQLETTFQPLSGLTSVTAEWQALTPGTYYFMLLVTDSAGATDSASISIQIAEASDTASPQNTPDSPDNGQSGLTDTAPVVPACGGGVLPLALLPLALFLMRRRGA